MTSEQRETRACELEARARMNEGYMRAMERTTARTNGRLGHENNPSTYAAHGIAAAEKRRRAADLRAGAL